MKRKSKCEQFHDEIIVLIREGKACPEISRELGLSVHAVSNYCQRELSGNPNYLLRKKKHSHLHENVLNYFLNHTFKETQDHFQLTKSELKSCFTVAYRKPELSHIRKDKRRKDSWSSEELRFLFRKSGIISRDEINDHLKRGKTNIVIKEKISSFGICTKAINGMTISQFRNLFNKEPLSYIQTTAGSPGAYGGFFKIVPWCHINEMLKSGYIDGIESVRIYIDAMSLFQKWIHGEDYWSSMLKG